jgi:hypothetical protein
MRGRLVVSRRPLLRVHLQQGTAAVPTRVGQH